MAEPRAPLPDAAERRNKEMRADGGPLLRPCAVLAAPGPTHVFETIPERLLALSGRAVADVAEQLA